MLPSPTNPTLPAMPSSPMMKTIVAHAANKKRFSREQADEFDAAPRRITASVERPELASHRRLPALILCSVKNSKLSLA
jgi:hypothetical protein